MYAYTPSAPPLTPAARAQIVAALCERAQKKQEMMAASNKASKLKWEEDLHAARKHGIKPLTVPQQISLPLSTVSTTRYTAWEEVTLPQTATDVESSSETTSDESAKRVKQVTVLTTPPSVEETKITTTIEETIATDSEEGESNDSVERPVLIDVPSILKGSKNSDPEPQTVDPPVDEDIEMTAESNDATIVTDETSSIEGASITDVEPAHFESPDMNANGTSIMIEEKRSEETKLPGEDTGVVRPLLFQELGKAFKNLQKTVIKRAQEDTKKLTGKNNPLTGAGGVAGVVAAITTLKK